MSLNISLDVFGEKQIDRDLLRIEHTVGNMTPALEYIADDFLQKEKRQFATQGGYASGGWKPLAPSTVARKAAARLDPRILHATLAMQKSLTVKGAPGQVRHVTPDSIALGTAVKSSKGYIYAKAHQKGNPAGNLPQRRPIELTNNTRARWVKILQRFIMTGHVHVGTQGGGAI